MQVLILLYLDSYSEVGLLYHMIIPFLFLHIVKETNVFDNYCTGSYSHQECMCVSIPWPCQYLLGFFSVFLILVLSTWLKWYFIVFLNYISMILSDTKYLFLCDWLFVCLLEIKLEKLTPNHVCALQLLSFILLITFYSVVCFLFCVEIF